MEYVARLFAVTFDILNIPLNIFGHTFSLWGVFVYVALAGIVLGFVWEAFLGD